MLRRLPIRLHDGERFVMQPDGSVEFLSLKLEPAWLRHSDADLIRAGESRKEGLYCGTGR